MSEGKTEKPIKIVVCAFGEMGHVIPISHITDALVKRGHDVHFVSNNDAYNDNKVSKTMTAVGCTNLHFTEDPLTRDMFMPDVMTFKESLAPDEKCLNLWEPFAIKKIKEINPDIVVCDFASRVGVMAADQLKIPSVINFPGLMGFLHNNGISHLMLPQDGCQCCGMVVFCQSMMECMGSCLGGYVTTPQAIAVWESWKKRAILCNSFWGLEDALSLPPNYYMTGPLTLPQDSLVELLKQKDPELSAWMDDAHDKGEKVVFVSIGSLARWRDWKVKVMYEGLKKVGCRVIWSLKGFEIPEKNDKFWVKPWIPQVEVLAHPALKAGLTHCGFGGCLEFVAAGIPIVAFPIMFDQHDNAEMMAKKGVAVILHNQKRESMKSDEILSYVNPEFDAQKVYETFNEILTNETYKHNILKLQKIQQKTGGRDHAVKVIEDTYECGLDHLIDNEHDKKYKSLNWWCSCMFWLIFMGVCGALIAFTVLYFVPEGAAVANEATAESPPTTP